MQKTSYERTTDVLLYSAIYLTLIKKIRKLVTFEPQVTILCQFQTLQKLQKQLNLLLIFKTHVV